MGEVCTDEDKDGFNKKAKRNRKRKSFGNDFQETEEQSNSDESDGMSNNM